MFEYSKNLRQRFERNEDGATAIEYGLIAAIIAIAIIASLQAVGTNLNAVFTGVAAAFVAILP